MILETETKKKHKYLNLNLMRRLNPSIVNRINQQKVHNRKSLQEKFEKGCIPELPFHFSKCSIEGWI